MLTVIINTCSIVLVQMNYDQEMGLPLLNFSYIYLFIWHLQLKKEGYELISDEVQQSAPRNPVVNAASSARPMPAGASTLGNPQVGHLGTAQRAGLNPQLMQGGMSGNIMSSLTPMQPSSPSQLAANRMPPPSNAPSRQLMTTHMGQQGITAAAAKPNQMEAAQVSQQQHHQLQQQQAQLQRQPSGQQQQLLAAQLTGQVREINLTLLLCNLHNQSCTCSLYLVAVDMLSSSLFLGFVLLIGCCNLLLLPYILTSKLPTLSDPHHLAGVKNAWVICLSFSN